MAIASQPHLLKRNKNNWEKLASAGRLNGVKLKFHLESKTRRGERQASETRGMLS